MLKYKLFLTCFVFAIPLFSQEYSYKFRLYLTDKGPINYKIENPAEYLSERAIQRRLNQNILIDETDFPISELYAEEIEKKGCTIVAHSKWLSTISVHSDDSLTVFALSELPFVKDIKFVWKGEKDEPLRKKEDTRKALKRNAENYGQAYAQIAMHRGDSLHKAGYKGKGMEIAVIDAGFSEFQDILMLSNVEVKGSRDFVYEGGDMFSSSGHGLSVLSCMAANVPGTFVGTAPEAKYWLFRSEDSRTEFPIEEDYWITAAEYADSVGVDIINTSLGYSKFNFPAYNYTIEDMDGNTPFITQGAEMAASKGIFVVVSAGNEGNKEWEKITAPADARNVLTVGAIKADSTLANFSSRGYTADGRIKPDVMAIGEGTALLNTNGEIISSNGTSYSGPVMCGLAACLWQAYPELTNTQLLEVIKKSSDRYYIPDNRYGYGIPDMFKAMEIAESYIGTGINLPDLKDDSPEFYNFKVDSTGITISKFTDDKEKVIVNIYDLEGKLVLVDSFTEQEKVYNNFLQKDNLFILSIYYRNSYYSHKIVF